MVQQASGDTEVSPGIVLDDFKLVYVPVAKAASSSIKLALRRLLKMPDPDPWWKIHETVWPRTATSNVPGYLHWTCVRNPFDRLYSCWASKLSHRDRFQDLKSHHDVLRLGMSFAEFVQALSKIDLKVANEHLRPQSDILRGWQLDRISKVEYLQEDKWLTGCKVENGNDLLLKLPHVNEGDYKEMRCNFWDYNEVKRLYKVDYDKFCYNV